MSDYTPGTYAVPYIQLRGCDHCQGYHNTNTGVYVHTHACQLYEVCRDCRARVHSISCYRCAACCASYSPSVREQYHRA